MRWCNNRDVVPTLEAMQKWMLLHHDKFIDTLKLTCTSPNLANFCLGNSTDAIFYPCTEGKKNKNVLEHRWEGFGCPSIVLFKWWNCFSKINKVMRIYYGDRCCPTKPLLDVNLHWPDSIRVGMLIQSRVDSHLDKARPVVLRRRSFPISKKQGQIVNLKVSIHEADWIKLTAWVLKDSIFIATLFSRLWVTFILSVSVKRYVRRSLKTATNVAIRRWSSMIWDKTAYTKKVHCPWLDGVWVIDTVQDNQLS